MKWIKRILIPTGILVVVGLGSFVLYNVAYAVGDAAGYDEGYSAGQKIGYSSGEQDGYSEGYDLGREEGYDEGYDLGTAEGYGEGYETGVEDSTGHGYTLRDPTYKEAVTFLRGDKTDRNKYVEDTYVCSHFAMDVCNNAEAEGLRCAFVEIRCSDWWWHAMIAFDTIDRGLVYFEPQSDDRVEIIINQSYSRLNDYSIPSYDDTITDILIIW